MSPEDRKKVPETHEIWIDIGAGSRKEAEKLVRIGDPAIYDQSFELIRGSVGVARGFDDKAGAYAVLEAVRRLSQGKLNARVTAAATTQEEIGTRGAITAGYSENPDFAIAVDVGHATDSPDCDQRKYGRTSPSRCVTCTRPAKWWIWRTSSTLSSCWWPSPAPSKKASAASGSSSGESNGFSHIEFV